MEKRPLGVEDTTEEMDSSFKESTFFLWLGPKHCQYSWMKHKTIKQSIFKSYDEEVVWARCVGAVFNPSIKESEAFKSHVKLGFDLHSEFSDSQGNRLKYLLNKTKTKPNNTKTI